MCVCVCVWWLEGGGEAGKGVRARGTGACFLDKVARNITFQDALKVLFF